MPQFHNIPDNYSALVSANNDLALRKNALLLENLDRNIDRADRDNAAYAAQQTDRTARMKKYKDKLPDGYSAVTNKFGASESYVDDEKYIDNNRTDIYSPTELKDLKKAGGTESYIRSKDMETGAVDEFTQQRDADGNLILPTQALPSQMPYGGMPLGNTTLPLSPGPVQPVNMQIEDPTAPYTGSLLDMFKIRNTVLGQSQASPRPLVYKR